MSSVEERSWLAAQYAAVHQLISLCGKNPLYSEVMEQLTGYNEIEHTADWELQVWAPDLPSLLEQAARGMVALSQISLAKVPRVIREFRISFSDRESLVVDFLSELLYFAEDEGLAFDSYQIQIEGTTGKFRVSGAPIQVQAKEIKAVTYHKMKVHQTERGLEVNIVFDV